MALVSLALYQYPLDYQAARALRLAAASVRRHDSARAADGSVVAAHSSFAVGLPATTGVCSPWLGVLMSLGEFFCHTARAWHWRKSDAGEGHGGKRRALSGEALRLGGTGATCAARTCR